MTNNDRAKFAELIVAIYTFYNKELSDVSLAIWWESCKMFDLPAVQLALSRHVQSADTGQFLPKPADVAKMMGGTSLDSALLALAKLEQAQSQVGQWNSAIFDDPLIHAVVTEMGGWVEVCSCTAKTWEFRRNEFLNRYRGYAMRGEVPAFPGKLVGLADAENQQRGFGALPQHTMMIGDQKRCLEVARGGSALPRLPMRSVAALGKEVILSLEDKS